MNSILVNVIGFSRKEVNQTVFAVKTLAKKVTRRTKGGWKIIRHDQFIELQIEDDAQARLLTKMLDWAASGS